MRSNVIEKIKTYSSGYARILFLISWSITNIIKREGGNVQRRTDVTSSVKQVNEKTLLYSTWRTRREVSSALMFVELTPREKIIALDWLRLERPHAPAMNEEGLTIGLKRETISDNVDVNLRLITSMEEFKCKLLAALLVIFLNEQ